MRSPEICVSVSSHTLAVIFVGAADELHFDHVLPFSRGGTSLTASNVQLLCARHNLQKSAKIE